jgi:demethylmenaquinone methyltransferase/2-methoxy-6-polyprenyl-1,4-benzoquinol methylase
MQTFFDAHAEQWDSYQRQEDIPIIREILARVSLVPEDVILDVACGTGVLIPFFLELNVQESHITGMDIAPKMVEVFSHKFPNISIVNANFEDRVFPPNSFTKVIIFNSFPHFANVFKVFAQAYEILKPGGKLTIAHTMNREKLDEHHKEFHGMLEYHSLPPDDCFADLFQKASFQNVLISNEKYFYAEGLKA